ncbi:MAG: carbohydrate-binding domain-containing protein [Clostridiales bacterium]|jgi:hypothetical protein|nr:carbohydrate-binding domain-containing protein [Clostridiales bacterium]
MRKFKTAKLTGLFLGMAIALNGCGGVETPNAVPSETPAKALSSEAPGTLTAANSEAASTETLVYTGGYTLSYEFAPEDTDSAWDTNSASAVEFNGGTAQISGEGAKFADGILTIAQAGTYVLSGTLADGQVLIDAGKNDDVRLVMNGVSLSNATGPAIYAPQSEKIVLILEKGTENTVSDGAGYSNSEDADAPDAAIFIQDNLSVTGEGTLTVTGSYKHGIRAQDVLAVTGGVISINSVGDALRGRDGVAIQNGAFTLDAGGDGIQSNNDEDGAKGFVVINGGTFEIKSKNDGIQAQTALSVADGVFRITTGGGSAAAPTQEENFRGRWGEAAQTETAEDESVSMKALKAGKQVYIAGGDFTVDAEDDAVHSNDSIVVTAGKFEIKTGDDGFHADAALEIAGGEISITSCYEGIEGLSVTIGGGDITVAASDDGINSAGGVDSGSQWGGPMGRDQFSSNGDCFVKITGGTLDLSASRDGIDANGNIDFSGGTAKISGPSQGMEGAIDLDGTLTVTGGELITAGSVLGISEDSTQPAILVSYTAQQDSGSIIAIKDANGNTLLEYTSKNSYSLSGFTSPEFKQGETYSLFIDGEKQVDIKLENTVTSISDDGGAYSGGGRGGWGGGTRPGGGGRPEGGGMTMPSGDPPQNGNTFPGGGAFPGRGTRPDGVMPSEGSGGA